MACAHPIKAYRLKAGLSMRGKSILFRQPDLPPDKFEEIELPCGQCINCRLAYARDWAVRMEHEASLHDDISFITLTYADEYLIFTPGGLPTLCYDDVTAFIKRLRSRIEPHKIRFYYSGEYGERFSRPHYHLIVFGWWPPDAVPFKKSGQNILYSSELLDSCWHDKGFVVVGKSSFDAFCYVAGYVLKKRRGKKEDLEAYYKGRAVEKSIMSRRPGIGHDWFIKYKGDVYPVDQVITSKGFKLRPPKYYDKLFFCGLDIEDVRSFKEIRKNRLKDNPPDIARAQSRERINEQRQRNRKRDVGGKE